MRLINSSEKCMIMKKNGERGDEEGGCRTVCYSPARVVVYRLLKIAKKCRNGGGRKEKVHHLQVPETQESRKSDDRTRRINVSGLQSQEVSFNLAAGLGVLSLIAASKTELDKTVELRKQMEGYLESFKDEGQSKVTTPKPSDIEIAYAGNTTYDGLSNYSMDDHGPSFSQQESGNTVEDDMPCTEHHQEESVEGGINHLEEELAAELDRLEFDVEAEGYVQTGEASEIQADATEVRSENTATESVNMSSGEVIDPHYVDNSEFSGVPPLELERRLHEVLETRQDERIKELEAHLERMNRRLQEKEVEVAWWKDTAKLISQQLPESSRMLR